MEPKQTALAELRAQDPRAANHLPPRVNYIEPSAKVDFPCMVHRRRLRYREIDFRGWLDIVHVRWLVEVPGRP